MAASDIFPISSRIFVREYYFMFVISDHADEQTSARLDGRPDSQGVPNVQRFSHTAGAA